MAAKLRVTLVKSPISHTSRTRGTVRALGLRRIGQTVEVPDTPEIRGMTRAVRFLLVTEEIDGPAAAGANGAESARDKAARDTAKPAEPATAPARRRSKKEESET